MQNPYIIVQSGHPVTLQDEVNRFVKEGYTPVGGIMRHAWGYESVSWYQAMYCAPEPDKPDWALDEKVSATMDAVSALRDATEAISKAATQPTWITVTVPAGTIDLQADEWIAEDGHLRVYRAGVEVAEFPPGQWRWVMVEGSLGPGSDGCAEPKQDSNCWDPEDRMLTLNSGITIKINGFPFRLASQATIVGREGNMMLAGLTPGDQCDIGRKGA